MHGVRILLLLDKAISLNFEKIFSFSVNVIHKKKLKAHDWAQVKVTIETKLLDFLLTTRH